MERTECELTSINIKKSDSCIRSRVEKMNKKGIYILSREKVTKYVMWLADSLDIKKIEWDYRKKKD
jgi:hypothetical protein